jgi:hypothetical protein
MVESRIQCKVGVLFISVYRGVTNVVSRQRERGEREKERGIERERKKEREIERKGKKER